MSEQTVWITGASAGIGEALAVRFAQDSARVVLSARRKSELEHGAGHLAVTSTITPGFIRTDISRNALAGDGSAFGEEDEDIAGGMDVNECAEVVFKGLQAKKREIPVGKGKEMAALWVKRISPEALFRITKARK